MWCYKNYTVIFDDNSDKEPCREGTFSQKNNILGHEALNYFFVLNCFF